MPTYIAFEGGEGSGKSTQAGLLSRRLGAVLTREPGGTELGTRLRELLLESKGFPPGPRAEALMMAADRAQHMQQVVLPALAENRHVVSDRSLYSSLAYQGVGRELGIEAVLEVNKFATYNRLPDVVVLLQITRDDATARLDRPLDRFEQEGELFHNQVLAGFSQMAAADPDRWLVVDGDQSVEEVEAQIWSLVEPQLARYG